MTPQRKNLPEPKHPFAQWGAGAAVSIWALGVQSFSSPMSQIGAVLSPGVGYILGQTLDIVIYRVSKSNSKRRYRQELSENSKKLDDLAKERREAIKYGADPQIIASIEAVIVTARNTRVEMMKRET